MAIDMTNSPGAASPALLGTAAASASLGDGLFPADNDQTGGSGAQKHDRDDPLSANAIAAERKAAFRRARRHSLMVRILKLMLPTAAMALIGIYGVFININHRIAPRKGDKVDIGQPVITRDGLAMQNPKYQGFNKDGSQFFVTAKQAFPDLKQPERITMKEISGTLTQANAVKTYISAKRGIFDSSKSQLDLFERIDISSDRGLKVQLNSASVFIKDNRIVTRQPIAAQMPGGTIRANAMTLLTKRRLAEFSGGVAVRLQPKPKPPKSANGATGNAAAQTQTDKTQTNKTQTDKSGLGVLSANSDKPVDVLAHSLSVNDNRKLAIFRNDVRVRQDSARLRADVLEIQYQGSTALPGMKSSNNNRPGKSGKSSKTRLKKIIARHNVVMSAADGRRATSERAEFDAISDVAVLSGNVVLSQGLNRVTSNRVVLNRKADTALLTGAVILHQGRNLLTGGRLFINRKSATSRLTKPGGDRLIRATFHPKPAGSARRRKQKSSNKKLPGRSFSVAQFKSDPNAPLHILARRLDVNDNAKSAIFSGKVIAAQGGMTIRTAKLIATYAGNTGMGLAGGGNGKSAIISKTAGSKTAGGGPATRLTRIEAREKVLITSRDGQSASGDWADFDVKANTVILGGNVVMKQGSTVILGEKLQIDMTSGQARIVPRRGDASAGRGHRSARTIAGGGGRTCPPGRTCLRLIPGALQQQFKLRGAAGSRKSGGGWGASTSAAGKTGRSSRKTGSRRRRSQPRQPATSASETYQALE